MFALKILFHLIFFAPSSFAQIDCLTELNSTQAIPAPKAFVTPDQLRADIKAYASVLQRCWANRARHEQMDGYSLNGRVAQLQAALQDSNLVPSDFYAALYNWSSSLADGHLSVSVPGASFMMSGLTVVETASGPAITACSSTDPKACAPLRLPAVIQAADGVPIAKWLANQETVRFDLSRAFPWGSTPQGRAHDGMRNLMGWETIEGSKFTDSRPAILSLANIDGSHINYPISWTASEPQTVCVTSALYGDTWVMKIKNFECDGLIDKINQAMASAPPFHRWMLDLRDNAGGLPQPAQTLIGYAVTSQFIYYSSKTLSFSGPLEPTYVTPGQNTFPERDAFLRAPMWLLTNGGCFSQCYMVVSALHESGRAKIVGQPPDGGEGGPTKWVAPSGAWSAYIPLWLVTDTKGREMEDTTIQPEIRTQPALLLFKGGADGTLLDALAKISAPGM